jgi:hypothetical protein
MGSGKPKAYRKLTGLLPNSDRSPRIADNGLKHVHVIAITAGKGGSG